MRVNVCILVCLVSLLTFSRPISIFRGKVELKADVYEFPNGTINFSNPYALVDGHLHLFSVDGNSQRYAQKICNLYNVPYGIDMTWKRVSTQPTSVIHVRVSGEVIFATVSQFVMLSQFTCSKLPQKNIF